MKLGLFPLHQHAQTITICPHQDSAQCPKNQLIGSGCMQLPQVAHFDVHGERDSLATDLMMFNGFLPADVKVLDIDYAEPGAALSFDCCCLLKSAMFPTKFATSSICDRACNEAMIYTCLASTPHPVLSCEKGPCPSSLLS